MGLTGAPLGLAALRSTRRSSRISGFRRKVTCHKGVVEILLRWVCHASDAWKKPVNVPSVPVPPRQHRYPPLQRTQGWGTLCGNGVGKTAKVGHPPQSATRGLCAIRWLCRQPDSRRPQLRMLWRVFPRHPRRLSSTRRHYKGQRRGRRFPAVFYISSLVFSNRPRERDTI